jgi:hypothetical protein
VVLVNYAVQFDYYASELCEEKNMEESSCNGSCQVSQELRSSSSDTEQKEAPQVSLEELNYTISEKLVSPYPRFVLKFTSNWFQTMMEDGVTDVLVPPPR